MSSDSDRIRLRHTNPKVDSLIRYALDSGDSEQTVRAMVPTWENSVAAETEEQERQQMGLRPVGEPESKNPESEQERRVRKSMGLSEVVD